MKIKKIIANEILTSVGYPTVEAIVVTSAGIVARASVPYGASAGTHEASILTDNEKRYRGMGVRNVIKSIHDVLAPELIHLDIDSPQQVDEVLLKLDGTRTKINFGGNAILAVSLACAKALAAEANLPFYKFIRKAYSIKDKIKELPKPLMVAIEGGKHAHKSTDMQEYSLLGLGSDGPTESIRKCLETYHALGDILKRKGYATNVGNEGAFAPSGIKTNEDPLKYIMKAIEKADYEPGKEIGIALDPAASEFFQNGQYHLALEDHHLSSDELIKYYEPWFSKYPIKTIEDMLHEDDWNAWVKLTKIAKKKGIENIGDDLTVTNTERLQKAIDMEAITSILIKLNQAGTLTETVNTCLLAKKHDMMTVPSHRGGGETNDTSMVDLAVAVGSKYIKVGPTRGERVSKYNRLMEIERELS